MNNCQIKSILKDFNHRTKWKNVKRRLGGSANKLVQWMDVKPNDLDIVTDTTSHSLLKTLYQNEIVDIIFKKKIWARCFICKILWQELEFTVYMNESSSGLDICQLIEWNWLKVSVMPLSELEKHYRNTWRHEKAEMIRKYLEK